MKWINAKQGLPDKKHTKTTYSVKTEQAGVLSYCEMALLQDGRVMINGMYFNRGEAELKNYWWLDETTEVIPEWVLNYDKQNHQSSAGKAIRILMNIINGTKA